MIPQRWPPTRGRYNPIVISQQNFSLKDDEVLLHKRTGETIPEQQTQLTGNRKPACRTVNCESCIRLVAPLLQPCLPEVRNQGDKLNICPYPYLFRLGELCIVAWRLLLVPGYLQPSLETLGSRQVTPLDLLGPFAGGEE